MSGWRGTKFALVVHSELGVLSKYQTLLSANGFTTVVARDLPTALLAITQHYFDLAIVSSQLGEAGDGWPLAGVLHLVFPNSHIGVLVPGADLLAAVCHQQWRAGRVRGDTISAERGQRCARRFETR